MSPTMIQNVGLCIVPGKLFHTHARRVSFPETLHDYTFSDVSTVFRGIFKTRPGYHQIVPYSFDICMEPDGCQSEEGI
jgi:hypothetical protein